MIFDKLVAATAYQSAGLWVGSVVVLTGFAGILAVAWLTRRRTPVLTTDRDVPRRARLHRAVRRRLVRRRARVRHRHASPGSTGRPRSSSGTAWSPAPSPVRSIGIFVAGHLFGTILLGVALWRARIAPTWLAIGFTVSQPIHLASVMTGIRPIDLRRLGPDRASASAGPPGG